MATKISEMKLQAGPIITTTTTTTLLMSLNPAQAGGNIFLGDSLSPPYQIMANIKILCYINDGSDHSISGSSNYIYTWENLGHGAVLKTNNSAILMALSTSMGSIVTDSVGGTCNISINPASGADPKVWYCKADFTICQFS
jgi:hypothetical protein